MRTRRAILFVVAAAILPLAPAAEVNAEPAGTASLLGATRPTATATVTLITGERILVSTDSHGHPVGSVLPGAAADPQGYITRTRGKDLYVTPARAAGLVQSGRLDAELFNVSRLVAQGYDDAHMHTIPLIAQFASASLPKKGAAPFAGSAVRQSFSKSHLVALSADKAASADFFQALNAGSAAKALGTSVSKVWLDRKVRASLDESVEQIEAPEAWAAGFDGTGTKVAVLDSGYDDKHPDLQGQVIAAEDFTGLGDPVDRLGHGTHVASTIAGTGAASGGKQRGVAPGAKLLIGRVLDDAGFGFDSWIIAGMEWAIAQNADVVNMSLSSASPTECTDPLGEATAQLSANTKTMFIVAAGNNGIKQSVGSPGCVPGVLTVGAVDTNNQTASFSSRGSVPLVHNLKPDIAAPGVGILAAALGSPSGNPYVKMSGTSMATPHVAGAAAILSQRQPKWTVEQRKAALISSATVGEDSVYAQGAGVVDVARAIASPVFGPGTTDAGTFVWPHTKAQRKSVQVVMTNITDQPVTLQLSLADVLGENGEPLAKGTITLASGSTLTVPAGGAASAAVVVDPSVAQRNNAVYGDAGARLVARGEDGSVVSVTPIGFWLEPKSVNVKIHALDRFGQPANSPLSTIDVVSLDDGNGERRSLSFDDEVFHVRAGKLSIIALITTQESGRSYPAMLQSVAYFGRPEIEIDKDTTIVFDSRSATREVISADKPVESQDLSIQFTRDLPTILDAGGLTTGLTGVSVYLTPSGAVGTGSFELNVSHRMYAPALSSIGSSRGTRLSPVYLAGSTKLDGRLSVPLVDGGGGTPEQLAKAQVSGKAVLIHVPPDRTDSGLALAPQVNVQLHNAADAGAATALFATDVEGKWAATVGGVPTIPGLTVTADEETALKADLAAGGAELVWDGHGISPYVYNLSFNHKGKVVPSAAQEHVRDKDLARVDEDWGSMGAATVKFSTMLASRPTGGAIALGLTDLVSAPSHRTSYYTAGETVWQQVAASRGVISEVMFDRPRNYRPGASRYEQWYAAPLTVSPHRRSDWSPEHVGERQDNLIGAAVAFWADTDPDHVSPFGGFTDNGSAELFAGGQSLGLSVFGPSGQWLVPAEDTPLTLKIETHRTQPGNVLNPDWQMSLATQTTWQFHSHAGASGALNALPMLLPKYDLLLDGTNRAPAVKDFGVRFGAVGQRDYDQGRLAAGRAWVSYDDGASWREVPVTASAGSFQAVVDNTPAHNGYVTLRVSVTDEHGAAVEQTITRAYGVK
ncbi:S8 family peptidase [Micromonospora chersina]|uniref:S8 family peptidase n=1 Tax=Micromonospora chersina TaxID=47854 RepID=UPI00378AFB95